MNRQLVDDFIFEPLQQKMPVLEYDMESQMYAGSSSSDAFLHNNETPVNQVQKKPAEMVLEGKYEDSETHTEKEFS